MGWGSGNLGGGSGGLNFKIVGGMSEPTSAKENTIWVNTSTEITDWVFSATQPTGATGRIWIFIGTSSPVAFNALKKNGIQVYPLSAKQYVSGAWADVTAKSYQGGEWVDWFDGYLINGSKLNTEFAGTWNQTTGEQGVGGSAEMTSEGLLITANQPTWENGSALRYGPDNKINLNNIKSIEIVASLKTGTGKVYAALTPVFATGWDSENVATIDTTISQTNQVFAMDVSGVNGEYYLRVGTSSQVKGSAYSYVIESLKLV